MTYTESKKFRFRAVLENVPQAIACVTESAQAAGFDDRALHHIQVAVDEACANVIQHGYQGVEPGDLEISCSLDDQCLLIRVRDWGRSFDPVQVQEPDVRAPLEERTLGGLGIFLIKSYMDDVRFTFDPELGNELLMIKRLRRAEHSGQEIGQADMYLDTVAFKSRVRQLLATRQRAVVEDSALICASVLIPLLVKDGTWHILLTQRTETVEHHKGQISFPGGACEGQDADLYETALRETFEEIGIPPGQIEILGVLDDYPTISSFVVTPFVGVIPYPFPYRPSEQEVEAIVEVPLPFLLDPSNLRVEQREHQGRLYDLLFWDYGDYTIWGATAQLLKNLIDLVDITGDPSMDHAEGDPAASLPQDHGATRSQVIDR